MSDTFVEVVSRDDLRRRVSELGEAIGADYSGRVPVLVGVLKGCDSKMLPSLEKTDEVVTQTIQEWLKHGLVNAGDPIVVVHGTSARIGGTNVMRIQYA